MGKFSRKSAMVSFFRGMSRYFDFDFDFLVALVGSVSARRWMGCIILSVV